MKNSRVIILCSILLFSLGNFSNANEVTMWNFQPYSSPAPDGYLKDDGSSYGVHGDYGWVVGTPGARDRNNNQDQMLDTFVQVLTGQTATWEAEVVNGTYFVSLVSGDSRYDSGAHLS